MNPIAATEKLLSANPRATHTYSSSELATMTTLLFLETSTSFASQIYVMSLNDCDKIIEQSSLILCPLSTVLSIV